MIDSKIPNPFIGSVVSDPWKPARADVPEIHAEAFLECCQAVSSVQQTHRSSSIIIHGEAGSGKTHLMARLRSYLVGAAAVFISIPLQTAPQMLWRHLRRCLIDDLLRPGDYNQSQFSKIAALRLKTDSQDVTGWLSQVQMDHDLFTVLTLFLANEYRRETRAWLRGDSLSEADLVKLNLFSGSGEEEDPEDKSRRVVLGLCNFFGSDICLVFCFDQVEALQNRPEEKIGLFAFGKMIRALHDGTENALLISNMQSSFIDALVHSVDKADKDRLNSYARRSLQPLTYHQALALIAARLETSADVVRLRQGRSGIWPLDEGDIKKIFEDRPVPTVSAREIIGRCAQLFEAATGKPPKTFDRPADFLETEWQRRLERRATAGHPMDSDQILQHGLSGLTSLGHDWKLEDQDRSQSDIDLIMVSKAGRRIEISLCNQQNMTSLAFQLKRLAEGLKKGWYQNLVLIRDPRLPIRITAKKTNEYLAELKKQGARMLHPPVEVLAALDALRSLLAEAKAGDLASQGQTIGPDSLQKWLEENMPSALRDFMEDLSARTPDEDDFPLEALLALLEEQPLILLTAAAKQIEHPPLFLEAWVRRNPGLVGLLTGPPAILFGIVPDRPSPDVQENPL
jgi:hypothetical protein